MHSDNDVRPIMTAVLYAFIEGSRAPQSCSAGQVGIALTYVTYNNNNSWQCLWCCHVTQVISRVHLVHLYDSCNHREFYRVRGCHGERFEWQSILKVHRKRHLTTLTRGCMGAGQYGLAWRLTTSRPGWQRYRPTGSLKHSILSTDRQTTL